MKSIILNHPRSILLGGLMLFVSSLGWAQNTTFVAKGSNTVKVIDNKGTIKYLQSSNGITTLTNTTSDVTTTTWQLGGSLDDDVNITTGLQEFKLTLLDSGGNQGTFVIDGIQTATSGYTLLVRESNGEVRELTTTDLIESGTETYTAVSADESADPTITATGVSTDVAQVWVFRNGAKLVAGTDYSVGTDAVTLISTNYPIYTGDVFEIQWVK
ncbi:MAG: hypothetical protein ACPF80_02640 [Flavobacteriaceae bacterium]